MNLLVYRQSEVRPADIVVSLIKRDIDKLLESNKNNLGNVLTLLRVLVYGCSKNNAIDAMLFDRLVVNHLLADDVIGPLNVYPEQLGWLLRILYYFNIYFANQVSSEESYPGLRDRLISAEDRVRQKIITLQAE